MKCAVVHRGSGKVCALVLYGSRPGARRVALAIARGLKAKNGELAIGNPTLVHHGAATQSTAHLTTSEGLPIADLYVSHAQVHDIAQAIATELNRQVIVLDNRTMPASTWAHPRTRVKPDPMRVDSLTATGRRRNPSPRIIYNKLLGGWYVVVGPHQTPLNGRFNTKAEAQAWLGGRKNPSRRVKVDEPWRHTFDAWWSKRRRGPFALDLFEAARIWEDSVSKAIASPKTSAKVPAAVRKVYATFRDPGRPLGRKNPSRSKAARARRTARRRTVRSQGQGIGGRRTIRALAKGQLRRAQHHALQSKYRYQRRHPAVNPSGMFHRPKWPPGIGEKWRDVMGHVTTVKRVDPTRVEVVDSTGNRNWVSRLEFASTFRPAARSNARPTTVREAVAQVLVAAKFPQLVKEVRSGKADPLAALQLARKFMHNESQRAMIDRAIRLVRSSAGRNPRRTKNPRNPIPRGIVGYIERPGHDAQTGEPITHREEWRIRKLASPADYEAARAVFGPHTMVHPFVVERRHVRGGLETEPWTLHSTHGTRPQALEDIRQVGMVPVSADMKKLVDKRASAYDKRMAAELAQRQREEVMISAGMKRRASDDAFKRMLHSSNERYVQLAEGWNGVIAGMTARGKAFTAALKTNTTFRKYYDAVMDAVTVPAKAKAIAAFMKQGRAMFATSNPRGTERARAAATFRMWQDRNVEPRIKRVRRPPALKGTAVQLGELVSVDYKSDKYTGRPTTYTHAFKKPRPLLVTDADGKHPHIVGGNVKITSDGLIN